MRKEEEEEEEEGGGAAEETPSRTPFEKGAPVKPVLLRGKAPPRTFHGRGCAFIGQGTRRTLDRLAPPKPNVHG
ncbi:hypothetical protein K0M31_000952 [Melipona bicolor]|uniref:Uncharacterized protein n=1 Tax=Melipona bicolor TaxID=60889 RepID=A0AA40GER3_9HYME|nr:hypothetical protein K0M31_000952 [Melipona bicolor]